MTTLTWTPPTGSPLVMATGGGAGYRLQTLDGLGPVAGAPLTSKGPGQPGSTALDQVVPERVITAQLFIQAASVAALWTARAALASAMAVEPVAAGASLVQGLLTFSRGGGLADLEIPAIPNGAPALIMPKTAGAGFMAADLEWMCPYPFWRATADTTVTVPAHDTPVNVANPGDALTPAIIQIYGDLTLVTVTNVTTGAAFQLAGEIPAGQYVEISTVPGAQYVQLVNGSVRTNWFANLNLAMDDLFSLVPGTNSISWSRGADGGSGARDVVFIYRPRTRGV